MRAKIHRQVGMRLIPGRNPWEERHFGTLAKNLALFVVWISVYSVRDRVVGSARGKLGGPL